MEKSLAITQREVEYLMEGILGLLRIFWRERLSGMGGSGLPGVEDLSSRLADECKQVPDEIRSKVVEAWAKSEKDHSLSVSFDTLSRLVLRGDAGDEDQRAGDICAEDARYFAMRAIRRRNGLHLSYGTAAAAHNLVSATSNLLDRSPGREISFEDLNDAMKNRARPSEPGAKAVEANLRKACVDVALVLNLFEFSADGKKVTLRPEGIDAEYMISHLFGIPTAIPGFDALFGGGGLMLTDSVKREVTQEDAWLDVKQGIGGRSVLSIGPFGSGKTLLSLQFAVEIARKGGVAWVMTLEQTVEECLYALESIGISTTHPGFLVADSLSDSLWVLSHPAPTRGALVFLRPADDDKTDYVEFLEKTEKWLPLMSRYPLRLLIVDPINALEQESTVGSRAETVRGRADGIKSRTATRRMFEAAKRARVNVWFTSEQISREPESNHFAENIADTVIHLGTETVLRQQKRFVEVTKSRFQQESPGRHGLVIEPVGGIHIHPSTALIAQSSALVARHISARPLQPGFAIQHFGVPGIERLLGPEPVRPGDVIAFAGPGKAKTFLGIKFLLAQSLDQSTAGTSLLISDYSPNQVERLVATISGVEQPNLTLRIEQCTLPTGYIDPGRILQEIREAFERCERKGLRVNRVLLTNLSRWEEEMPFIVEDLAFGIALVTLIRSYQVAAVVVCGDTAERGSRLRDTIFDQADTLLHFHRKELHGRATTLVSAVKTRSMRHQREVFELAFELSEVQVRPAPLVRLKQSGDVIPIKISLFLHAETANHQAHNQQMEDALRATIAPETEIGEQGKRFDPSLLSMSRYSAVDELQIFQLDEFQLPSVPSAAFPTDTLHSFDAKMNAGILEGRLPEFMGERIFSRDQSRFFAVPFYANLSFLAVHKERLERMQKQIEIDHFPESWADLAKQCKKWDEENPESTELLFSCAIYGNSMETYNCLFFEILCSLEQPQNKPVDLAQWLSRGKAIQAGYLFWLLGRRSHALHRLHPLKFIPKAAICRHWYNTLNQELSEMDAHNRAQISVIPLFGERTTAGEWYLAVPSHSASPEIGLRLIEELTTAQRETSRVELGVGLPTRTDFYQADSEEISVSRYFPFSRPRVYELMKKAMRRSDFKHYQQFSSSISSHLQWLLEIPGPKTEDEVMPEIARAINTFASNLRFLNQKQIVSH
jgi:KaiC/GvpD/RAD55 family RecA-like ATPase